MAHKRPRNRAAQALISPIFHKKVVPSHKVRFERRLRKRRIDVHADV